MQTVNLLLVDSLLQYTWHNDAKAIQCIIRIVVLVDCLLPYTWHYVKCIVIHYCQPNYRMT